MSNDRGHIDSRAWPWPPELDALVAAPNSHRLLLDHARVRVLEVTLPPGVTEPVHTHRFPSVMVVMSPARIRYFVDDQLLYESPDPESARPVRRAEWLEPEGPHNVENIDVIEYRALRFELKQSLRDPDPRVIASPET
jgi:hypothetical protein